MHGKICICKPIGEYGSWRSPAARSAFREKYLVARGLLDAQKFRHIEKRSGIRAGTSHPGPASIDKKKTGPK